MNVIQEIHRINQAELESGIVGTSASWHDQYKSSAWVYIGNLPTQLTEGDILAVMSQWGEIEDINLVRQEDTGKSKGFCFLKYEDSRSCVLAVDNFNGTKILGRSMRVDHVENYRLPKHLQEKVENQDKIIKDGNSLKAGHAYEGSELANEFDISKGRDLFAPQVDQSNVTGDVNDNDSKKEAKRRRKEERDQIRREREARRQEREEKKRMKRAKKLQHDDHKKKHKKRDRKRSNSDSDGSSRRNERRHERKYHSESDSESSRNQIRHRRIRRYDSDDER